MQPIEFGNTVFTHPVSTKRLAYYRIKDLLLEHNCISIIGQRYIGKTIILRQLENYFNTKYGADTTFYIDLSTYREDCLDDLILNHPGTEIFLLDEVTTYNQNEVTKFVKDLVGYYNRKCVYTGSNPHMVSKYSESIGRGIDFNLCNISYGEQLCWDNNIDVNDIDKFLYNTLKYSTDAIYKKYLNSISNSNMLSSVLSSVTRILYEDHLDNYTDRNQSQLEDITMKDVSILLAYITINTLISARYGEFNTQIRTIDKLHDNLNTIKELKTLLKNLNNQVQGYNKYKLASLISLFTKTDILRTGTIYMHDGLKNKDLYVTSICKLLTYALSPFLDSDVCREYRTDIRDDLLVENDLLYLLSYIKPLSVGSYREMNQVEFDLAYKQYPTDKLCVSEVKNTTLEEVLKRNYHIQNKLQANQLGFDFNLVTYSISSTDRNLYNDYLEYRVIPNHVLNLILTKYTLYDWSDNLFINLDNIILKELKLLQDI